MPPRPSRRSRTGCLAAAASRSRRAPAAGALALLLLAAGGCGSPQPTVDATATGMTAVEADMEAIRGLSRQWAHADSIRDVARAVMFYAPEAVLMASETPLIEGRDAIQRWYEAWLLDPRNRMEFDAETVEVSESGDLAYERGVYRFWTRTGSGERGEVGKYLSVWKRVDGQWKVIARINNSDRPGP